MTPAETRSTELMRGWLQFWFQPVSMVQLALMRIGVGLILLYNLFVTSFDLEAHFGIYGWGDPQALLAVNPLAWPFSVLNWFPNPFWLWAVHILAIIVAVAFIIGIMPFWSGVLSLVFVFSYAHRNPAQVIELDALLWMSLFYILLTPCGRVFGVMASPPPTSPAYLPNTIARRAGPHWEGFPIRMLQVHLCVLYFQAGLSKLTPDWLAGTAFWHPRLVETGLPSAYDWLRGYPQLSAFVIYGVILFLVLFPLLIWMPRFRYLVLAAAVVVHLFLGLLWGHFPLHFLMLITLLAFVLPDHLDAVVREVIDRGGPMLFGQRRR